MEMTEKQVKQFYETIKRMSDAFKSVIESINKATVALNEFNEAMRNGELGKEQQRKFDEKKREIIEYAKSHGFECDEIEQYLTDEIIAQALCYDFCPQTVCDMLIRDKKWQEQWTKLQNEMSTACFAGFPNFS